MRTIWRVLTRTVFWSYERGTWPYDVAVIAIVIFVLATPRAWFNDQPPNVDTGVTTSQDSVAPPEPLVRLVNEDPASGAKTYRVDARLIESRVKTPEFDHEIHDVLKKNVSELAQKSAHGRNFEIRAVDWVRGTDGAILYYDVVVKR